MDLREERGERRGGGVREERVREEGGEGKRQRKEREL